MLLGQSAHYLSSTAVLLVGVYVNNSTNKKRRNYFIVLGKFKPKSKAGLVEFVMVNSMIVKENKCFILADG